MSGAIVKCPAFALGPMPLGRPMTTVDELFVRAPVRTMFAIARDVLHWQAHLSDRKSVV